MSSSKAFSLYAVLIISLLSMLLLSAILKSVSTSLQLRAAANQNSTQSLKARNGIQQSFIWMQGKSLYFANYFTALNFPLFFEDLNTHSKGDNDESEYALPSAIRLVGTDDTPIISANAEMGLANFPTATKLGFADTLDLNANFEQEFPDSDPTLAKSRISLFSVHSNGTSFSPKFRIDSISNTPESPGRHLYAIVEGSPILSSPENDDSGFFASSSIDIEGKNSCRSVPFYYDSTWHRGAINSNCRLISQGNINLSGEKVRVFGIAKTNQEDGINGLSKISRKNAAGCSSIGCHNITLRTFSNYATSCPSGGAELNISSDASLEAISGSNCWDRVTIAANSTLNFTTVGVPYYIKELVLSGSSAKVSAVVNSSSLTDKVEIHIDTFSNYTLNSSQIVNPANVPSQFKLVYTGASPLAITGKNAVYLHLFVPIAALTLNGSFEFYGSINANALTLEDSVDLYSDEVGTVPLSMIDMSFQMLKINQSFY